MVKLCECSGRDDEEGMMNVGNWTVCPKCMKKAISKKEQLGKQAKDSYGKVSELQYIVILKKAQADIKMEKTLRHDYKLYMEDDGIFTVNYKAHCDRCGFAFKFEHKGKAAF